jgi:hypothetical protein
MNRSPFLREFPHHAQAVRRLDEAIDYAQKEFPHAADRERFVEQARARIAERIAEGRLPTKERDKDHGGRTR